jgi:tetratricopeptide (TPR) repeat protein
MRYLAVPLLVSSVASADWIELSSPNFQLYTNGRTGDARRTIEYFEQVRDFFMRVKSASMTTRLPVTIVLFKNAKEFKPYAPNQAASAYYLGDRSRDFIIMSGAGDEHFPLAVHEYMHLLIRHTELKLPVWLNEGIAEVYSTLKPFGGKILVGSVPQGRAISLQTEKWLKLDALFAVRHDSPEYNEKDRAGILYAQSWMLTHMLMLDGRFSPDFAKFATLLTEGSSSQEAFLKVYGRTTAQLTNELSGYFRSNQLKGALFDTRLQKVEVGEPRPADPTTVELTLARLVMMLDRKEEASARLQRLAAEHPGRWEVWETMAQAAWHRGELPAARDAFRRATALKPPAWNLYWDYAQLAANDAEHRTTVIDALRESLRLNGANQEARLMLGWKLYEAGQDKDAMTAFATIRNLKRELAPRLFLGIGATAIRLENWKEARTAATQLQKFAKEPQDIDAAQRMLDYLDRREQMAARAAEAQPVAPRLPLAPAAETTTAPVAGETTAPSAPATNTVEVRGLLREVKCDGAQARLRVHVKNREFLLLIDNPDRVTNRNAPGTPVTLTCGPQSTAKTVIVEYVEREDTAAQTSGDVRALEFTLTSR